MGTLRKLLAMYGLDPSRTINDIHKKKKTIQHHGNWAQVRGPWFGVAASEDMGEDLLEKDQKKQVGSASWTTRQKSPHAKLTENLRIRSMLSATCIMIFHETSNWLPRSECSSFRRWVFSTHVLSFGFGKRRISITSFGQGLIQTAYLRPLFGALLWCQEACLPWTESLSRNLTNSWKASFIKMRFLTIHHFVAVNTDHHTRDLGTLKCAINHFCHVRNTIGNLVAMILRSVTMATWLHLFKLTNVPLYQGSLFIVSRRCWARGDVLSDLDVRWNDGGWGCSSWWVLIFSAPFSC